jgi:DNA-binding transcriptional regulator YhcF (GntR family)
MRDALVNIYARQADRMGRDPVSQDHGRATVPMGRGFGLWQRMNAGLELVYIDDAEGRPRALTPKQYAVLVMALDMIDGDMLTMRAMAAQLKVAPSTVSRALTKLAAWGIIAYVVGRGRWAGLVIIRRAKNDGLERFRKAAQTRVRNWYEAAQRRFSRSVFNVASIVHEDHRGYDSLTRYVLETQSSMDATLTTQRPTWTVQELREGGII